MLMKAGKRRSRLREQIQFKVPASDVVFMYEKHLEALEHEIILGTGPEISLTRQRRRRGAVTAVINTFSLNVSRGLSQHSGAILTP